MDYFDLLERYTPEERASIAQMKRLFERAQGDPSFAVRLFAGRLAEEEKKGLQKIGVAFDLENLALFRKEPGLANDVVAYYAKIHRRTPLDRTAADALNAYPLLKLWFEFSDAWGSFHLERRTKKVSVASCPGYAAWRLRRIKAVGNELGVYGRYLSHSTMAFELSEGCSRRCAFCAYAPGPLKSFLPFSEGGTFFRECLEICIGLFGKEAVGESLLYYATEPYDNGDYTSYLAAFTEMTGVYPCTSTAVVRNEAWLRSLIDFYKEGRAPYPRLSVLSAADLSFFHERFSCEEALPLHLSMMMKGTKEEKVKSGRLFENRPGMKAAPSVDPASMRIPQGSISCVSGFLVNLTAGTVKVVSPCYSSERWPLGYRVFDEDRFERKAESFRDALRGLIERNMPEEMPADRSLGFRDDFEFRETVSGFDLVSYNQILHFTGGKSERIIGKAVSEGFHTCDEITAKTEDEVDTLFFAPAFLRKLFEEGVLNEIRG